MDALGIGRLLRMMRLRRGWRLRDLAGRSRLSTSTLGRHELGLLGSLVALQRHAAALDLRADLRLLGRGTDVMRVADEEHAAIVNLLLGAYEARRCPAEAEVSFSEWGERGRVDLVASDPMRRRLILHEVKTELDDLQAILGSLDVRLRLAPAIARRLGWPGDEVVMVLAVASTDRNHAMVKGHRALFATFRARTYRGNPLPSSPRELLWVPAVTAGRKRWLAGRRQIRS